MRAEELIEVNKTYFVKASEIAVKTAIFGAFPYLNRVPFNFLISKAVDWIIIQVANNLAMQAFFIYVDFRVNKDGKNYVQAAHIANTLQTEESRKAADEAFKRFARFSV